ncbi:MAG: hypothetical protein OWQ50_04785 [Acidianus infernus]|nr:hypothetical protein [Acidianus infernus]
MPKVDWIIAMMPTNKSYSANNRWGILTLLHQYKGPDSQAVLSQYTNDESAKEDILKL